MRHEDEIVGFLVLFAALFILVAIIAGILLLI